jgi:thioredoxin-like negative regulator of GroEL
MRPHSLEKAEKLLRHAATYQEYDRVDARIAAYCDAARQHLAALTVRDSRHRAALTHVLDVLEWSRLMLCAGYAAQSQRLQRAVRADRFLGPQTFSAPTTRLDC